MISSRNRFRAWGILTVVLLYLLILIGGIVRATGSGMGCPDWPKCFGKWIPPTNVEELPQNYKEIYADKRKQKNLKLAKVFQYFNLTEISDSLLNDDSMYREADFNPTKTWIEYINRLFGVLVGFSVTLFFAFSIPLYSTDTKQTLLAFFSLVLVIFEGWLGSIVVSTNLLPFVVTLHMFLAMILVGVVLFALSRNVNNFKNNVISANPNLKLWAITIFCMSFVQVLLGTTVREQIDAISVQNGGNNRTMWIDSLDYRFYIHRSFSVLMVIINILYFFKIYKIKQSISNSAYLINLCVLLVLGLEIITGIVLAYLSIPSLAQPIHLTLGCLLIGLQIYSYLLLYPYKKELVFAR